MSHRPVISETDRARIRLILAERGERNASELLGIDRHTIARCLAALPVYPGTAALVATRLELLRRDEVAHP